MDEARIRAEICEELPLAPDGYADDLVKFEAWFWEFFPALENCHEDSAFEMEWLWTRQFNGSHEAVHHSKALADLKILEKSLRFISEMRFDYCLSLVHFMMPPRLIDTEESSIKKNIFDFVVELNAKANAETDGVRDAAISQFIADCREAILATDDKKNINWEAIKAIDGLRVLWWRNNGRIEAPIALNPEAQFADFLRGGFHFLDVGGDVVSAFRAWRRFFYAPDVP